MFAQFRSAASIVNAAFTGPAKGYDITPPQPSPESASSDSIEIFEDKREVPTAESEPGVAPRSFSSYECAEEEKERFDMSWRLFVLTVLLVGYLLLLILPLEQGILPSNLQQTCLQPILALHTNRLCEMASKTLKQSSKAGIEKSVFCFYLLPNQP